MDHSVHISKVLPIVPTYNEVLLPNFLRQLYIDRKETVQLMQKIYRTSNASKYIVGCVPIEPKSPSALSEQSKDDSRDEIEASLTDMSDKSPGTPVPVTRNVRSERPPEDFLHETRSDFTKPSDLHPIGCAARIIRVERAVGGRFMVVVKGIARIRVDKYILERPYLEAEVTVLPEPKFPKDDQELQTLAALLRASGLAILHGPKLPGPAFIQFRKLIENFGPGALADMLVNAVESTYEEKLQVLDALDLKTRLIRVIELLSRHTQGGQSGDWKITRPSRNFFPRQQEDLGGRGLPSVEDDEVTEIAKKLKEAQLPPEVENVAFRELKRFRRMHPTQAEYQVVRTYLDWLSEIPWSKSTTDVIDIAKARQQLDDDHYGLESVKKRVLEFLAVLKLKGDMKGPILCLLGPPGVGKTSLGKSIASALGRKFHRISLGGVRDEAEIRGHRRTYIGSMPGLIAQGLRRVGVNNPVFLLDEIDKVGHLSNHGDPSAALLEVLDPEQNNTFNDHYLNVPMDLSKVLFIATANQAEMIPLPLRDRTEIIALSGYTFDEKIHIAQRHLLPKQIAAHGLDRDNVNMGEDVLFKIATGYTREAGVRNFEREIAGVCRSKAVEYGDAKEKGELASYRAEVTVEDIEQILGVEKFDDELAERTPIPGVATGLAWTASGSGSMLFIEVSMATGKGSLQLTGNLGDIIKESAQIALSWVRAHAFHLGIVTPSTESSFFAQCDIHIHFPAGAVGKDGPSAGVTLITGLVSLFTNRVVPTTTAMTGEVTLRGQVLPVGGIKEKIIAAHRAGIKKVILPLRNRKDVEGDVPVNVRESIEFVYVKRVYDVLQAAFEDENIWVAGKPAIEIESRL